MKRVCEVTKTRAAASQGCNVPRRDANCASRKLIPRKRLTWRLAARLNAERHPALLAPTTLEPQFLSWLFATSKKSKMIILEKCLKDARTCFHHPQGHHLLSHQTRSICIDSGPDTLSLHDLSLYSHLVFLSDKPKLRAYLVL